MKQFILLLVLWNVIVGFYQQEKDIDPTGTYKLESATQVKNDDIYGYFGEIQVKQYSKHQIIMTFSINRGAPSYNSGSFVDTLDYSHNQAIYTCPEFDPSCNITFAFSKNGITVKEKADDLNAACGFGHAVVADGFFKKIDAKVPLLKNPMTDEVLE